MPNEIFTLKIYKLGPINDFHSSKLLEERSPRMIHNSEINELYDIHPMGDKVRKQKILQYHSLIKYFGGHPQLILIASSFLQKMTLAQLYEYYLSLEVNQSQRITIPNSIKASLNYTMNVLKKDCKESLPLFEILWFFPGGILIEDLIDVCKKDKSQIQLFLNSLIEHSAVTIQEKYVIEKNDYRSFYCINQMLIDSGQHFISLESQIDLVDRLIQFYCKKLDKIMHNIGGENSKFCRIASGSFLAIERNLKYLIKIVFRIWYSKKSKSYFEHNNTDQLCGYCNGINECRYCKKEKKIKLDEKNKNNDQYGVKNKTSMNFNPLDTQNKTREYNLESNSVSKMKLQNTQKEMKKNKRRIYRENQVQDTKFNRIKAGELNIVNEQIADLVNEPLNLRISSHIRDNKVNTPPILSREGEIHYEEIMQNIDAVQSSDSDYFKIETSNVLKKLILCTKTKSNSNFREEEYQSKKVNFTNTCNSEDDILSINNYGDLQLKKYISENYKVDNIQSNSKSSKIEKNKHLDIEIFNKEVIINHRILNKGDKKTKDLMIKKSKFKTRKTQTIIYNLIGINS